MADHDLYSGLVRLHVLYHAAAGPIFGLGMMQELRHHGYRVGPGTLYPMLHRMEKKGYLRSKKKVVQGKMRRVYVITTLGRVELPEAKEKVRELYEEMVEGQGEPSPAHPSEDGTAASAQGRSSGGSKLPHRGGEGFAHG
jgi:PadR family transcriptional regulator, regulatory protein PadR